MTAMERCLARLAELAALKDGWWDGCGMAVTPAAISAATEILRARPVMAKICHIFPTSCGGVMIEFVVSDCDYSIISAPNGQIDIYGTGAEFDALEFELSGREALASLDRMMGRPNDR